MLVKMKKTVIAAMLALMGLGATPALLAAQTPVPEGAPKDSYNQELNLPYWAPGRGETDHAALRRRILAVLKQEFGAFQTATDDLQAAAKAYCAGKSDRAAYLKAFEAAWLAWAPLDSYQFGPMEQASGALRANFWPDKKDFVGRALRQLIARSPDEQKDPDVIAEGSAAGQGFPAIERLLFSDMPECTAIIGISAHLHLLSGALYDGWFAKDGWADLARAAGPDNPIYASEEEFTKRIYTALDFGLTRIADSRVGRPLGTFKRSFPKRAEAWRSGLTEKIIDAQLAAIGNMVEFGFAGDIREPDRAWVMRVFAQAHDKLAAIGMPIPEAVQNPATRFRVEALQTKIHYLQNQMAQDVGPGLGVDTGFSAADGD